MLEKIYQLLGGILAIGIAFLLLILLQVFAYFYINYEIKERNK